MDTLQQQADTLDAVDALIAALATLKHLGYTYHGGEQWKPPLGSPPKFDGDDV